MLIDTHCHLDHLEHKPLEDILADAESVGVKKFLCIGASKGEDSCRIASELSTKHENIWASIGVHPHDAGKTDLACLLYTSPSPRDATLSRMPSSA